MLTGPAFNALLKTLEEPPKHAVFVLATTEYDKVPPTITSRTQRFIFKKAAKIARYKGILDVTDEPLVSSDFVKNSFSSIVDLGLTKVVEGDFVKVVAWYANEWGYSMRLGEMAEYVGKELMKKA